MLVCELVVDYDAFGAAVQKGLCNDLSAGEFADELGSEDERRGLAILGDC